MYECKNLDEVIWLKMNNIPIKVLNLEGKVVFYADDESEEFTSVMMEHLAAKQGFKDIECSYTRLLRATKWVKDKIHENK